MCSFYWVTIESIITSCIAVWYGGNIASCRKTLQRIVNEACKIMGISLPSLMDIFHTRLTSRAISIAADNSLLLNPHFSLLPSGRRYWSLQARSTRLSNSFIHQALRRLNSVHYLTPLIPTPELKKKKKITVHPTYISLHTGHFILFALTDFIVFCTDVILQLSVL